MRLVRAVGFSGAFALSACGLFPDLSILTRTDSGVLPDGGDASTPEGGNDAGADADAAVATCPPVALPATCDSQYLSDPKNCCVAGHDCQGGACTNGKCQPVVIVSDATSDARGITTAGSLLLWATGCTGVVRKVDKFGVGNTPLPAGKNCTPTVAVSGKSAYWIEYNGPYLNTTLIDGSQPATIVAEVVGGTGTRSDFARLAVDAVNAYWATTSPPGIWYAPLASAHITALPIAGASVKESVAGPYGVAVDAAYVYWADESGGYVKRRALSTLGQNITADLVINETGPHDLAVDATKVYFVTNDGFVRAIAKDGSGVASTLASGQASAESIIVDDQYVYWTIYAANATVNRAPKSGGPVETLATGQSYPYSITQDCDTIYWTNQADFSTGQIVKLAK
jgi:hypothetical protein